VQRVARASLTVDGELISKIGRGIVVLTGLQHGDTEADLKWMCNKILNLRLWENDGKTWNRSVKAKEYDILLVSQFTLYATLQRGNKPDFHKAMPPDKARSLYSKWVELVKKEYSEAKVRDGKFGAMMQVELVNDGPVTFEITTDEMDIPGKKKGMKPEVPKSAASQSQILDIDSIEQSKIPVYIKRTEKKLSSIVALASRQSMGEALSADQLVKLQSEAKIREQLEKLQARLS